MDKEINKNVVIENKYDYHDKMGTEMDLLLAYQLGKIVWPLQNSLKEQNNPFMQLSSVERNIIGTLNSHGECTMGELAGLINCSYKNISKFMDNILQEGYIERYLSNTQKRYVFVRLTEKGREFHRVFQDAAYTEAQKIFDKYFTDEEQLLLLDYYEKINKIYSNLDKDFSDKK